MAEMTRRRKQLLDAALEAAGNAYAPYSGFRVGAAVMDAGGRISMGCNVENASYGLSLCAERVAIHNAVCGGSRDLREMVVTAAGGETDATPCGACRQVLVELYPEMIVTFRLDGEFISRRAADLLPNAFRGSRGREGDGGG